MHTVRGNCDLLSTTSNGGYQEVFMGTDGTAIISEDASKGGFLHEMTTEESQWEKRFATGPCERIIGVGPSVSARRYPPIPVPKDPKTEHQPHLENFFRAICGAEKLNCPAEVGFETAATILKVDQAIAAEKKLPFSPEDFQA